MFSMRGLYRPSTKEQQMQKMHAKIREIQQAESRPSPCCLHAALPDSQVKKRRDEREVERQLLEQQRLEHDKALLWHTSLIVKLTAVIEMMVPVVVVMGMAMTWTRFLPSPLLLHLSSLQARLSPPPPILLLSSDRVLTCS